MDYVYESQPAIIEQDRRLFARILFTGLILGAVVWAISYALSKFVISGMVCGSGQATCELAHSYAGNIALVFAAIAGILVLVKAGAYRPVIITLGATVSLWGISAWLYGVSAPISAIITTLLYALAFVLFGWIARVRKPVIMLIIFVIIMLLARFVPMIML